MLKNGKADPQKSLHQKLRQGLRVSSLHRDTGAGGAHPGRPSAHAEFRQIKNAVIQEAERLRLGEVTFEEKGLGQYDEPEEYRNASGDYRILRDTIRDESLTLEERGDAVSEMDKLAERGDRYAQYSRRGRESVKFGG